MIGSVIVNTLTVLQCPPMAHAEWYPTGYARHPIILNDKESKDSAPKAASVKVPKAITTAPKSVYVKSPKAKAVKAHKAKAVKAPKSAKTAMSNISEP